MAAKSKRKGKSGEREVCKIFGDIFGGSWIRVPGSGSFVGGKNAIRKNIMSEGQIKGAKADIIPPDEIDIVIEAKSYGDFPWHRLIQQEPIPLLEDWLEEIYDCIDDNDFWLLCVKINHKGWFVLFDPSLGSFTYNNHSTYFSPNQEKSFIVTATLESFLKNNTSVILELSKPNIQ